MRSDHVVSNSGIFSDGLTLRMSEVTHGDVPSAGDLLPVLEPSEFGFRAAGRSPEEDRLRLFSMTRADAPEDIDLRTSAVALRMAVAALGVRRIGSESRGRKGLL